jgi:hypothetical protein
LRRIELFYNSIDWDLQFFGWLDLDATYGGSILVVVVIPASYTLMCSVVDLWRTKVYNDVMMLRRV